MGSYVDQTLISGEEVLLRAHLSVWAMLPQMILGLLLLPFFGLGLLVWLAAFIKYQTTELAFTNKRVIAKSGFISRKTIEMKIEKVESVQVNQGILGRIFDFGSLVISGAGNPQAPIAGVSAPMTFRQSFMEHQSIAKM